MADGAVPEKALVLSWRARRLLRVKSGETVELQIPARVELKVAGAMVDDLPGAEEIDVSPAIAREFGNERGNALLVSEAAAIPVRLRSRDIWDDHVRLRMLTRALAGVPTTKPAAQVQLTPIGDALDATMPRVAGFKARIHDARASCERGWKRLTRGLEHSLRAFLRAPVVALGTTEALVGDDANQVVRIAPAVFPLLGIKAGDQVFVAWEGREAVATVLEEVQLDEEERATLRSLQWVDLPVYEGESPAVLKHLTIGVPADMRSALAMPRRTVVTVRRRLTPVLAGRLNELTIPVGGLLLAAATIKDLPGRYIIAGLIAVTALAMLPLRHRTPPRGRWL